MSGDVEGVYWYCYYHSYLNPFEEKDYLVEEKFFENNPNKGKLYNKIIGEAIEILRLYLLLNSPAVTMFPHFV